MLAGITFKKRYKRVVDRKMGWSGRTRGVQVHNVSSSRARAAKNRFGKLDGLPCEPFGGWLREFATRWELAHSRNHVVAIFLATVTT